MLGRPGSLARVKGAKSIHGGGGGKVFCFSSGSIKKTTQKKGKCREKTSSSGLGTDGKRPQNTVLLSVLLYFILYHSHNGRWQSVFTGEVEDTTRSLEKVANGYEVF